MTTKLAPNAFRALLQTGRPLAGMFCGMNSPVAAEAAAALGYDWVLIDMEHGAPEIPGVIAHLQAIAAGGAANMVRVPWNDPVIIKRVLDAGATAIMVPMVQNAEEASRAVAATRYPPAGIRGVAGVTRATRFGLTSDYIHRANAEVYVVAQIETLAAVDALPGILAVDGLDAIFIGPTDLASSMGHPGDLGHAEVLAAVSRVAAACQAVGRPCGIFGVSEALLRLYAPLRFQFTALGTDLGLLVRGARTVLEQYRAIQA